MKKKMLIVNNTMGRAGAERALVAFLKSINPEDFEVDVLAVIGRGEIFLELPSFVNILNKSPNYDSIMTKDAKRHLFGEVLKALLHKGYFIRHLPYLVKNLFLQIRRGRVMFEKLVWHALALRLEVPDREYDLAMAFTEGASTYFVAERVNAKRKAAFVQVDYTNAGYIKSLDKRFYYKIDTIFLVSQAVKDGFLKVYPELEDRLKTFQHIILPEELAALSERDPGFEDDFNGVRVLTVARLHPQKALDIAVRAFARLIASGCENVRWYIIGEGDERKLLEELIAKYSLEGKFILLGESKNPHPEMAQCDIYVQATHFEGWSIALASALVFHRPCIVSNVAGNTEQVEDGETGIVIELNEENLADALKRLVSDEQLRHRFSENHARKNIDYKKDIGLIYDMVGK